MIEETKLNKCIAHFEPALQPSFCCICGNFTKGYRLFVEHREFPLIRPAVEQPHSHVINICETCIDALKKAIVTELIPASWKVT